MRLVNSLLEAKQLAGSFLEVGRGEPVWMQIRKNTRESIGGPGSFAPLLSLPFLAALNCGINHRDPNPNPK